MCVFTFWQCVCIICLEGGGKLQEKQISVEQIVMSSQKITGTFGEMYTFLSSFFLHWLPIKFRISYKIVLLLGPKLFSSCITNKSSITLQSNPHPKVANFWTIGST